jgi:hypothetical protein
MSLTTKMGSADAGISAALRPTGIVAAFIAALIIPAQSASA